MSRRVSLPAFHQADTSDILQPLLCLVVDTEEDFDWTGSFSRHHTVVQSLEGIHRGHRIFRSVGLRPCYVVDHPIISDARAGDIFGPWLEANECVIGAHLHPWVTPPFEEVVCPYNSYACNLDADLERRKLAILTEKIRQVLGLSPLIYKAGRYGLDIRREDSLRALGFEIDTSVLPFRDYSGIAGGPNFFGYPEQPFWTNPANGLFYLPTTQALIGPLHRVAYTGVDRWIYDVLASRLRLPSLLARLRLLERIMLSPEGVTLMDLQRLTSALVRRGQRIFVLSLHSPSLAPGRTPYVRSAEELDAFLHRIEGFLAFFFGELGGRAIDPIALKRLLTGARQADPVRLPRADPALAA